MSAAGSGPLEETASAGGLALRGRSVLITRSPDRAAGFVRALEAAGARPYLLPLIDFETAEFSVVTLQAGDFDWLVISSITTVRALKARAEQIGLSLAELVPESVKIATIGPSSRRVLEAEGLRVALAPEGVQSAAGLVSVLPNLAGQRVWLPQSNLASAELAEGLRAAGAELQITVAYRTVDYPAREGLRLTTPLQISAAEESQAGSHPAALLSPAVARDLIAQGSLDAVIAASPSAADRIAATLAPLRSTRFIAIGQPTAEQAERIGLRVAATAATPTPQGIVEALQCSFTDPIFTEAAEAANQSPGGTES